MTALEEQVFDFYGVRAAVRSDAPAALDAFRRDFAWFAPSTTLRGQAALSGDVNAAAAPLSIRLTLRLGPPPSGSWPAGAPRGSLASPAARDRGSVRAVRHGDRAEVTHDFADETGEVVADETDLLHELGYILLLSRVGEFLDRRGLHRVHALAFTWNGCAMLCPLPMGGGKTTLALGLIRLDGVRLLSEDTPLVDRHGRLWPFPVRFGVSAEAPLPDFPLEKQRLFRRRFHGTKVLLDIDVAGDRWAPPSPVPPYGIFLGRRVAAGETGLSRRPFFWAVPALVVNLVVGLGVPQGREYILRPRWGAWARLATAAVSRTLAMVSLLLRSRVFVGNLGPDRASNLRALERALSAR